MSTYQNSTHKPVASQKNNKLEHMILRNICGGQQKDQIHNILVDKDGKMHPPIQQL